MYDNRNSDRKPINLKKLKWKKIIIITLLLIILFFPRQSGEIIGGWINDFFITIIDNIIK